MSTSNIWFHLLVLTNFITLTACRIFYHETNNHTLGELVVSSIIKGIPSKPRPFFVKVATSEESFCGGTIIHPSWVVTSARCVFLEDTDQIIIEVGDFVTNNGETPKFFLTVESVFDLESFQLRSRPKSDIALLKLDFPIDNSKYILPLCEKEQPHETKMGACGLGSTSTTDTYRVFPRTLQEAYFLEVKWESLSIFNPKVCPVENVCTTALSEGTNICFMDEGGPLYTLKCGTREPECLYGVASYSVARDDTPGHACNGGSYFTSIVYHLKWISYMIELFTNEEN